MYSSGRPLASAVVNSTFGDYPLPRACCRISLDPVTYCAVSGGSLTAAGLPVTCLRTGPLPWTLFTLYARNSSFQRP